MNKLFALLMGLMTALISTAAFASSTPNPLADTSWILIKYDTTTISGISNTLSFESDKMYSKFCNNVSQGYTYANESITSTSPGMSTMMYCEGLPMTLENNFVIGTGTSAKISNGDTLTITTSENHVFVLTKEMQVCTLEYAPVCGSKSSCIATQGDTCATALSTTTYGNRCQLEADGARFLREGACESTPVVGGDVDEHGCKASAGYSRGDSMQQCIRPREFEGTLEFALEHQITSKKTVASFRADDKVTRQEAASMIIAFAKIYRDESTSILNACKTYKDDKKIASGLKKNVYTACKMGFMKGRNGSFHPYATLTKTQALKIIASIANIDAKSIEGSFDNNAITRGGLIKLMHDAYTQ